MKKKKEAVRLGETALGQALGLGSFFNFISLGVLFLSCCVVLVYAQTTCDVDADCGGGQCCSVYGYCGSGPDYCRAGCVLDDVEFVGGDLSTGQGGGGTFADRDDACAKLCEDNRNCNYWTFDIQNSRCYLKSVRGRWRNSAETGIFISGSTLDAGCNAEPPCLEPNRIVDGICQPPPPPTTPRPPIIIFTPVTPNRPPIIPPVVTPTTPFLPPPPQPTGPPKRLPTLPTLPPRIENSTFFIPPLQQNTFQGAFDYCANLGGVLPSFDFFDIYNIGERPRASSSSRENTDDSDLGGREVTYFGSSANRGADAGPRSREAFAPEDVDLNEIDEAVVILNKHNCRRRIKRQTQRNGRFWGGGFGRQWYWLNVNNDGRTCYAALPGDVVRYRAFSCDNLLRVICQTSLTDNRPLYSRRRRPLLSNPNNILNLINQVPASIIKANPKKAVFSRSGISNPYLNFHAQRAYQKQQKRQRQRQRTGSDDFFTRIFQSSNNSGRLRGDPPAPNQIFTP